MTAKPKKPKPAPKTPKAAPAPPPTEVPSVIDLLGRVGEE